MTLGLVKGCFWCGNGRCRICESLAEGKNLKSNVMGRSYVMNCKMDCNTDYVTYLLSCTKCFKQYVGSTITTTFGIKPKINRIFFLKIQEFHNLAGLKILRKS